MWKNKYPLQQIISLCMKLPPHFRAMPMNHQGILISHPVLTLMMYKKTIFLQEYQALKE
jgi:hypothetical protein